jgi:hypothetical protein
MNNYDENMYQDVPGNNNDTVSRLLFIALLFFGHILFYYTSYIKYKNLTSDDDEMLTHVSGGTLNLESVQEEKVKESVNVPYEEKYMTKVGNMKNEYIFTDEELEIEKQKLDEFKQEENSKRLESTYILNEKIEELTTKLREINDQYNYDKVLDNISQMISDEDMPSVCHTCHICKPLRSKHCKILGRCIHKFDHFCPFVGNTVCRDNYKYFVGLLASHMFCTILWQITLIYLFLLFMMQIKYSINKQH